MSKLRAYLNYDCLSAYDGVVGQVDIYELDDDGDIVAEDFESYSTEEQMNERVEKINNGNFTWDNLQWEVLK